MEGKLMILMKQYHQFATIVTALAVNEKTHSRRITLILIA
jgi:hypothetical protein